MATAVAAWSMRQLVEAATVVAIVEARHERSVQDIHTGVIETRVELVVQRGLWGAEDHQVLEIRTRGGTLFGGARTQQVNGEARFAYGEHALVFLQPFTTPDGSSALRPVGMAQGVMHIMRGSNGGNMVQYSGGATVLVMPNSEPALTGVTPAAQVLDQVSCLLEEIHARPRRST